MRPCIALTRLSLSHTRVPSCLLCAAYCLCRRERCRLGNHSFSLTQCVCVGTVGGGTMNKLLMVSYRGGSCLFVCVSLVIFLSCCGHLAKEKKEGEENTPIVNAHNRPTTVRPLSLSLCSGRCKAVAFVQGGKNEARGLLIALLLSVAMSAKYSIATAYVNLQRT